MGRTAVEIVRAYGVDAWTQGRDDLIPELCHDPIIRHDADREVRLSHAEQRARMRHNYEELRPVFEDVVLAGDDEYVTLVWNVTGRDPNWKWSGIEVFRVVDGRIAEVWNSTYQDGHWGLSKSLVGSVAGGQPVVLPLMRADLSHVAGRVSGKVLVPADPQGLASWFAQLFGAPTVERDGHLLHRRFAPGGVASPLALTVVDRKRPPVGLTNIAIPALTIEWERSGLINAAIELTADETTPLDASPEPVNGIRLSETIGSFERTGVDGRVVEAGITIAPDGRASGRVALRLDDPAAAPGTGKLALGWREGERMVMFEGEATLSAPSGAFADGDIMQANYSWQGTGFAATIVSDAGADI